MMIVTFTKLLVIKMVANDVQNHQHEYLYFLIGISLFTPQVPQHQLVIN